MPADLKNAGSYLFDVVLTDKQPKEVYPIKVK
jgi:hypothetical protein